VAKGKGRRALCKEKYIESHVNCVQNYGNVGEIGEKKIEKKKIVFEKLSHH